MSESDPIILAAQGYYELEMHKEALAELDRLPLSEQILPEVLEMRVLILMKDHHWKEALDASEKLCAMVPEEPSGFIHAAYCLHEMGKTRQAKELLLEGPAALATDPTYHYNLACYECALGNIETARAYLKASVSMDKELREFAQFDPDLKALRE
jgi:predicted Zn-dependent protease